MTEPNRVAAVSIIGLLLAIATPPAPIEAGSPPEKLWLARYAGGGHYQDHAQAVVASPQGDLVFVSGYSSERNFKEPATTIAYDSLTGAVIWKRHYLGAGGYGYHAAPAIDVSPNGAAVFVAGTSQGATSEDAFTVAYDAHTGGTIWAREYRGSAGLFDYANDLTLSADGSTVFVTGGSYGGKNSQTDVITFAYDAATGDRRWVRRYDGPGHKSDEGRAVGVSDDGTRVFVAGARGAGNSLDYVSLAYDAFTGRQLWVQREGWPSGLEDSAISLAVVPGGGPVVVTGYVTVSPGDADHYTVAYDASTGLRLWDSRYGFPGGGFDVARDVDVALDRSAVYVTGSVWYGEVASDDYVLVALALDSGDVLWEGRYGGRGAQKGRPDFAHRGLVGDTGDQVFVTGASMGHGPTAYDIATVAFDASTGSTIWVRRYSPRGTLAAVAADLAIGPSGSLFVAGGVGVNNEATTDWITVAYG